MLNHAVEAGGISVAGDERKEAARADDTWQTALLNVADMLGPVSHDLHNVMNNIVLNAALLARDAPESMRQQIAVFKSLAYQASQRLNELDEYRHQVRSPKQAIDIGQVTRKIVDRYGDRGVAMECQLEEVEAACANEADVQRLVELLIAAAQAAGPPVGVSLFAAGGTVVLRVEDHGSDVDPDKLDQLFEPFAVTREGERTLERTACRVIARRLEAKLRASPRRGGGVAVTVEFKPATT
jgi:signal transduction histidine kinase